MKKYLVEVCQPMWTSVVVEAENKDEAESKVHNDLMDKIPISEFTEEGERYVPEGFGASEIISIEETEDGVAYKLK